MTLLCEPIKSEAVLSRWPPQTRRAHSQTLTGMQRWAARNEFGTYPVTDPSQADQAEIERHVSARTWQGPLTAGSNTSYY